MKKILLTLLFVYFLLVLKYILKPAITIDTLFIEQESHVLRNDCKLTLYCKPPINLNSNSSLISENLHRCCYSRFFYSSAKNVNMLIFPPSETSHLDGHYWNLYQRTQTSRMPSDVVFSLNPHTDYPFFNNPKCIELTLEVNRVLHLPSSWWIIVKNPKDITLISV
jgi:hypothetical protein